MNGILYRSTWAEMETLHIGNVSELVDTHQMGIDPETLKVHFKQGIEYDEHAGRGIVQPLHGLGRELLTVCWQKFLNTKLLNLIFDK